ncbi:head GIN domain-containing protein [Sunxiuqinia sp. sy24]|uniref:head GIN domain-containing protein n=1 Tax=Sunxiuqinia sp. sy24 TaxID=3461495 RepID=UPI0040454E8E
MMKTRLFPNLFFLLTCLLISALASAAPEWDDDDVRVYDVANFERIVLEGGYKVILKQADQPGLRIKADEEAFEYIKVDSDRGTLSVTLKEKHFSFDRMILYIEFVELQELRVEGGINLETRGYLDLDDFDIQVEGGAMIEMEMKVDRLNVVGEGGVSFDFRGVANSFDARISGAGHLDADKLKARSVAVEIEGVGGGSVYATDYLKAKIEGVGKIRYKGNPEVDKQIEGIGFVSPE